MNREAMVDGDLLQQYARAQDLLAEAGDVLLGRTDTLSVAWAEARGWSGYLLGLSDDALASADTLGIGKWFLADARCPASLCQLARRVEEVCRLPRWQVATMATPDWPFTAERKRRQITAVLHVLRSFYPAVSQLVDVGAGRGHLTTRAARALSVPALGLEKEVDRVAVARLLAGDAPVEFVTADLFACQTPLAQLQPLPDRLLVALHGCGELGDVLVRAAVALSAHVLLLACCPQKIRADERPSLNSTASTDRAFPPLPKEVLGLANVLSRTAGVEGPLVSALAAKEARIAVRCLFQRRGILVPAGEEMRGVNRRKVHAGLAVLAAAALQARGLAAASEGELQSAAEQARGAYRLQRRLSLPRSMLGRALEVFLALDRAVFLLAAGYEVRIVELFPVDVSPRNIAVLGRAGH